MPRPVLRYRPGGHRDPLPGHQVADQGAHIGPAPVQRHPGDARAAGHVGERRATDPDGQDAVPHRVEHRIAVRAVVTNRRHVSQCNASAPRGAARRRNRSNRPVRTTVMDMLWSGWGDPAEAAPLPDTVIGLLRDLLGVKPRSAEPVGLQDIAVPGGAVGARRAPGTHGRRGRRGVRAHRRRDPDPAHTRQVHPGPAAYPGGRHRGHPGGRAAPGRPRGGRRRAARVRRTRPGPRPVRRRHLRRRRPRPRAG